MIPLLKINVKRFLINDAIDHVKVIFIWHGWDSRKYLIFIWHACNNGKYQNICLCGDLCDIFQYIQRSDIFQYGAAHKISSWLQCIVAACSFLKILLTIVLYMSFHVLASLRCEV